MIHAPVQRSGRCCTGCQRYKYILFRDSHIRAVPESFGMGVSFLTADEKERIQQLRLEGLSYTQIASAIGVHRNTIKSFCRRNMLGDSLTSGGVCNSDQSTACKYCGKKLHQIRGQKPKKYCSDKCRFAWWNENREAMKKKALYKYKCAYCNREFESYGSKNRKFCGHTCYIASRFEKAGDSVVSRAV